MGGSIDEPIPDPSSWHVWPAAVPQDRRACSELLSEPEQTFIEYLSKRHKMAEQPSLSILLQPPSSIPALDARIEPRADFVEKFKKLEEHFGKAGYELPITEGSSEKTKLGDMEMMYLVIPIAVRRREADPSRPGQSRDTFNRSVNRESSPRRGADQISSASSQVRDPVDRDNHGADKQ